MRRHPLIKSKINFGDLPSHAVSGSDNESFIVNGTAADVVKS